MSKTKTQDFSREATQKAVLNETMQHPVTLGLSALGILGGTATALFNLGTVGIAAGACGLTLGVASFLVNYYGRRDVFVSRRMARMHEILEKAREEKVTAIKKELKGLVGLKGAEEYAKQGANQFDMAQKKYLNIENILQRKFESHELTYGRYLGTAEQVYLSVLDNLLDAIDALKSIETIDVKYIQERFQVLDQLKDKTDADEKEMKTLHDRRSLRETQLQKVNELLTDNEEAMTVLDRAAASISEVQTGQQMARGGVDGAIDELTELANRARKYDK